MSDSLKVEKYLNGSKSFESDQNDPNGNRGIRKFNKLVIDKEKDFDTLTNILKIDLGSVTPETEPVTNEINLRNSFDEAAIEERLKEMDDIISNEENESELEFLSDSQDNIDSIRLRDMKRSESTEKLLSIIFPINNVKSNTQNNIKQLLNHESQHLGLLTTIQQYKYILQESKVSDEIIWNIFHNISDLIYAQKSLVNYLESVIIEWNKQPANFVEIMDLYSLLHIKCKDYVKNIATAIREIKTLFEKNEKFKQAINTVNFEGKQMRLEELISKPVNWLCNSLEHIKSLIENADEEYDRQTMKETFRSLKDNSDDNQKTNRNILETNNFLRSNLFVELMPNDQRKLRHVFLFSGILVCARQKLQIECNSVAKHSHMPHDEKHCTKGLLDTKSIERFDVKWFICLKSLVFHLSKHIECTDRRKNEIAILKDRIRDLKFQLITEKNKLNTDIDSHASKALKRSKSNNFSFRKMMIKKDVDKLCNQILKIQKELLLISPNIAFMISNGPEKPHTLLVPSVKDLEIWKSDILKAQREKMLVDYYGISMASVNSLIDSFRRYSTIIEVATSPLLHEDGISGVLVTNIYKVTGLNPDFRYSLSIEVDSFKLNELKARTKSRSGSFSLLWNESFDIDLDCSQTMSILIYEMKNYGDSKEDLIGYFEFKLRPQEMNNETFTKSVPVLNNESVKLTMEASFKFEAKNELMKRRPSIIKTGLFGISLKAIVSRERSKGTVIVENVPVIIAACLKRIEESLDEEGIYRISGSKNEINDLYKILNKNSWSGVQRLGEYDLHSITGIVKMYLRELPEPIMMSSNYEKLKDVANLGDEKERFKQYEEIINQLPEPNHSTVIFLLRHFERVCAHSSKNQMIAGNLGLILGNTLIMPPCTTNSDNTSLNLPNIAMETMNSMVLARVFTHIMHGVCKSIIGLH